MDIDDVRMTATATEEADCPGYDVIQRRHVHRRIAEQPSDPRLPRSPSPRLSDHSGGNGQIDAVLYRTT